MKFHPWWLSFACQQHPTSLDRLLQLMEDSLLMDFNPAWEFLKAKWPFLLLDCVNKVVATWVLDHLWSTCFDWSINYFSILEICIVIFNGYHCEMMGALGTHYTFPSPLTIIQHISYSLHPYYKTFFINLLVLL